MIAPVCGIYHDILLFQVTATFIAINMTYYTTFCSAGEVKASKPGVFLMGHSVLLP